jgi:hypothetical protein
VTVLTTPRLGLTRWSAGTDPLRRSQLDSSFGQLEQYAGRFETAASFNERPVASIRDRYVTVNGVGGVLDPGWSYRDNGSSYEAVGGRVGAVNTAIVAQVIRGLPGQTARHAEWQNSAGTAVAAVNADGSLVTNGNVYAGGGNVYAGGITSGPVGATSVTVADSRPTDASVRPGSLSISVGTPDYIHPNGVTLYVSHRASGNYRLIVRRPDGSESEY